MGARGTSVSPGARLGGLRDAHGVPSGTLMDTLVRSLDFNRAPKSGENVHGDGYKEWLHFCVRTPELELLVNFSAVAEQAREAESGRAFRTIVLLKERGGSWQGDIARIDPRQVEMPGGRVGLRFADSEVRFEDGRYRLRVRCAKLSLRAELELTPLVIPTQTLNMEVRDGPPHNWAIAPRLAANGSVTVSGKRVHVENAASYHDHNWGTFQWGGDFAWEWGYMIPEDPACPWCVVAVRFADRAHAQGLAQGLFLWKGARQARIFRGEQAEVRHQGLFSGELVKLPPVMGLLRPGRATDVPARYEVIGREGADELRLTFVPSDVAQVMIPNDSPSGMTIIHEVAGRFDVAGSVHGERVEFGGGGIFEFLGN